MRSFQITVVLLALHFSAWSQAGLFVPNGQIFSINAGTTVSIDSLVLIPSGKFTLSGIALNRSTALANASQNNYVRRVYRWNAIAPAFTGTIGFYYRDAELNGLSETALTLNVHNGVQWLAVPPSSRDAPGNYVVTAVSALTMKELTLASNLSPLPLRWISTTARNENGRNYVQWITSSETNCKDYQVEKSINGNWQNMSSAVAARNTVGPNSYRLDDPDLPAALTLYRIRQTDWDGRSSYSETLVVRTGGLSSASVYPNPVGANCTVVAGRVTLQKVEVYNAAGALVYQVRVNREAQHRLNSAGWTPGSYRIVALLSDGSLEVLNVIKTR